MFTIKKCYIYSCIYSSVLNNGFFQILLSILKQFNHIKIRIVLNIIRDQKVFSLENLLSLENFSSDVSQYLNV